jgi:MarR family transcriptional regulator, organic hydroperoxide resistance regulator
MSPAEELRYLILAIQREGDWLLAADLRPLDLTPSPAEVIRVLADHQPLTMLGLGERLVCETGRSPNWLVDRLVAAGVVRRASNPSDRRHVELTLTKEGERMSTRIADVEARLDQTIDHLTEGTPVQEALVMLRAFASHFPLYMHWRGAPWSEETSA